jgi:hypothetical protein
VAVQVQDILAGARDALTVKRVFGEPYEKNGEGPEGQGKGLGGGFGIGARPVGAFLIRGSDVTWRPAVDVNRIVVGGQIVAVVALLTIRTIAKARAKART